jgi:hypothetical protein
MQISEEEDEILTEIFSGVLFTGPKGSFYVINVSYEVWKFSYVLGCIGEITSVNVGANSYTQHDGILRKMVKNVRNQSLSGNL